MLGKPLVSMITYCYNGERFISAYFDAILAQTYTNIELIFFNNGSEDKTGEIAEAYRPKLEARGIRTYIEHYEKNQLTCSLKEKGFGMMTGEYFFGCDSDDLIDPTYIEEMVEYLQNNPDKGIVYCQLRIVDEATKRVVKIMKMTPRTQRKEAFVDILNGSNINFTAISYMMSRRHFERVNPDKKIYQSRFGENYQVQMPFLYHDLQGYIQKPLGQYTVRLDSYTGQLTSEKKYVALQGQEVSVIETLKKMNIPDYQKYRDLFLRRIRRDRFYTACATENKTYIADSYRALKEAGSPSLKDRTVYYLSKLGISYARLKRLKK